MSIQAQVLDRQSPDRGWAQTKGAALAMPGGIEAAMKPRGTVGHLTDHDVQRCQKDMGRGPRGVGTWAAT